MGITTRNFGPDQSFDGIDLNGAYSFQSEIYITKYSATGFDFTTTRSGKVYTGSYIGSLDYLSFTTLPKTLEDLLLSNANSPFSSYVIFKNGVLESTASSSSPLSLSSWIYSNAELKNLTIFNSGDDVFYSSTNNQLSDSTDLAYGYGGNDVYHANHNKLASDDIFYGGTGVDLAILSGQSSHYTISAGLVWDAINNTPNNLTGFTIKDNTNAYNTLQINQVEGIEFSDTSLQTIWFTDALNLLTSNPAQFQTLTEMYIGYFNRAPDAVGLDYWASQLYEGMTLSQIADSFFDQAETKALYTTITLASSAGQLTTFINSIYNNVLNRAVDSGGLNYWLPELKSGQLTASTFILDIIYGALASSGDPTDTLYLTNKASVGSHFALTNGLTSNTESHNVMNIFNSTYQTSGTTAAVTAANALSDQYLADVATTPQLVVHLDLVGLIGLV